MLCSRFCPCQAFLGHPECPDDSSQPQRCSVAARWRLVDACKAWVHQMELRAGGRFCISDGAEFGSSRCWWGKRQLRPTPHEGIDLCEVSLEDAAEPWRLPAGFELSAVSGGMVVAVFGDFLAHTVIVKHVDCEGGGQERSTNGREGGGMEGKMEQSPENTSLSFCWLLAHVEPAAWAVPGSLVSAKSGLLATIAASNTTAPPHVHLSLLAAPASFSWNAISSWPDLLAHSAAGSIVFLDPLGG
mmetsp:Transcript_121596/g.355359  ORF Transcript_121596/g.355359 Transcript_121596/m.355359 type:complete len:244 (-) Transcript_121596:35-766(-)